MQNRYRKHFLPSIVELRKHRHFHHILWEIALRKHAHLNILKNLPPKNENFQIKFFGIFHISAQNIDCGHSLEPPRFSIFQYIFNIFEWACFRNVQK